MTLILSALIFWVSAWVLNAKLADSALAETRAVKLLVPLIFGLTIIGVWELLVRGLNVPLVILPPPSLVVETAAQNLEILWKDLVQTFIKGAFRGYVIGCMSALFVGFCLNGLSFYA